MMPGAAPVGSTPVASPAEYYVAAATGNRRRRVITCGGQEDMIARQSTARTFIVGPVLDADGVAVTDCVVGDFKVSKNGAAPAGLNGSSTLTHRHTGFYSLASAAGDFDTVGGAQFTIDDTTNTTAPVDFTVMEEATYDGLFAASANGFTGAAGSSGVNVNQWLGSAVATPTTAGVPEVDVTFINGHTMTDWDAQTLEGLLQVGDSYVDSGFINVAVTHILETGLTEGGSGRLAGAFSTFFNVATPTGTVNLVPANITQLLGSAIATPTTAGVLEVDVTRWVGTAVPVPTQTGVPLVNVGYWDDNGVDSDSSGRPDVNVAAVNEVTLDGTGVLGDEWGPT